jgi:hypothetical protein
MIYLGNFLKNMNRYNYCSNLYVHYLCIGNLYTTNIVDGFTCLVPNFATRRINWRSS